jgi:hypothetical protein
MPRHKPGRCRGIGSGRFKDLPPNPSQHGVRGAKSPNMSQVLLIHSKPNMHAWLVSSAERR